MNCLITADCVCKGTGSVPWPGEPEDSISRIPGGACIERYNRWRETCANADPLALMTAERDALRAAIRAHREAMQRHRDLHTDCPEGWDSPAAIAAAADARAALKASREALFALVPESPADWHLEPDELAF